jgi:hypothetical protein
MSTASNESRPAAPVATAPIIFEAIVRRQAVAATYNGVPVTLAPHVIYTRHDDLFIDAITLDRDGKPPKETKVGTFKLAGLNALRLTPRGFPKHPLFQANDPKYDGVALMTVDPA